MAAPLFVDIWEQFLFLALFLDLARQMACQTTPHLSMSTSMVFQTKDTTPFSPISCEREFGNFWNNRWRCLD